MGPVSLTFLGLASLVSVLVFVSMLRHPALRRIGLRNFGRRKSNTLLVILGSMVGAALISGSLVLNDSTGRFQYEQARDTLGEIDEVVQLTGQRAPGDTRAIPLFDQPAVAGVTPDAVRSQSELLLEKPVDVDGVLPMLTEEVPGEVLGPDSSVLLASPSITVIGVDWGALRSFGRTPSNVAALRPPGPDEVYVSDRLAKALEVAAGSRLRVRGPSVSREFRVLQVVPEGGISGYRAFFSNSEGTLLTGLDAARGLLGASPAQVNTLLISNKGDFVSGVNASDAVVDAVRELLRDKAPGAFEFQIAPVKKETLQQGGFQIGDIFLMISSFAILAGILLIINIYTMLAEERKSELGILRAVALKRAGLIRVFVYEGYAYSFFASLLGTLVGLGIAAGLVWGLNRAVDVFADLWNADFSIPFYVEPESLLIAASAGLLITFLTVFITSLRISGLNIVTAIRDLPDQRPLRRSWRRMALQGLFLALGILMTAFGFGSNNGYLMLLGPLLALFGLGFVLSRARRPRLVWSVVSLAVLAYAYFADELEAIAAANEGNPAVFFLQGVFMVLAAVLLVTFNLGILFWFLKQVMRWFPALAAVLRIAVAYPSSRRARTGFTLAMFALVLYLVTISSIFSSTQNAASERTRGEQLSGYDAYLQEGPVTRLADFGEKVQANPTLREAVEDYAQVTAGQVELPTYKAADYRAQFGPPQQQVAPDALLAEYINFASPSFLSSTTDTLEARLPEYGSDREAWQALARDPSLAILTYPYNGAQGPVVRPKLDPGQTLKLRDPVSGAQVEKRIIGRIKEPSGFDFFVINGVIMGEGAGRDFSRLQTSSFFLLHLDARTDPTVVNRELKKEFAASGAQSFIVSDLLRRGQQFLDTFVSIVQAFLAFGLIVGVAGLAVISARAVHERRRDIGTMRAVGYRRGSVGWQFIIESSFIALLGILIGIGVGTLGGYNLFTYSVDDPNAEFVFPWTQMLAIGLGVWVVSLLFTIVPALRASRIPPVEALRYQG